MDRVIDSGETPDELEERYYQRLVSEGMPSARARAIAVNLASEHDVLVDDGKDDAD